jgi:hypothetical protein
MNRFQQRFNLRFKITEKAFFLSFMLVIVASCSSSQEEKEKVFYGEALGAWHAEPLRYDPIKGDAFVIGRMDSSDLSEDSSDLRAQNRAEELAISRWNSSLTPLRVILKSQKANPMLQDQEFKEMISGEVLLEEGEQIFITRDRFERTWVVMRFPLDEVWFRMKQDLEQWISSSMRSASSGGTFTRSPRRETLQDKLISALDEGKRYWQKLPKPYGLESLRED